MQIQPATTILAEAPATAAPQSPTGPRLQLPREQYLEWLSADLVKIRSEEVESGRRYEHVDKAGSHFAELTRFFPLAGATLADAIASARAVSSATARMHPRGDDSSEPMGYGMAVAVLQAADGAYWGTVLGTGPSRKGVPVFDPSWPYTRIVSIQRLHDDVRAVVGVRDDVRFLLP